MKRITAVFATLLLALFGSVAVMGSASATVYPEGPQLGLPPTAAPGDDVPFSVTGLMPGSDLTICYVFTPAGGTAQDEMCQTLTADEDGTISGTIPNVKAGTYSVTAEGVGADEQPFTAEGSVTVDDGYGSGGGDNGGNGSGSGDGNGSGSGSGSTGGTDDGGLANTGASDSAMLLALGAGALLIGGSVVVATRSRRWGKNEA